MRMVRSYVARHEDTGLTGRTGRTVPSDTVVLPSSCRLANLRAGPAANRLTPALFVRDAVEERADQDDGCRPSINIPT